MPLQQQILSLLSHEQQMLSEVLRTTYRTEGKVDHLSHRVDRLEDREQRPVGLKMKDFLPFLPGAIALALVAMGKMSTQELVQLLGSGH